MWVCILFDRLVREAFLTMCGYRVEAPKQRTQRQIRDRLGWGLGRGREHYK